MKKIVVADHIKYMFDKNGVNKKIIEEDKCRYNVLVSTDWVERTNDNTFQNGYAYIVKEKETKEYYEKGREQMAEREEKENIRKALATNVLQEAANISNAVLSENIKKSRKKLE